VLVHNDGQPKITDFGLAKAEESPKLTQAGAIMGSPHYLSPEQASGQPTDQRSDIYSFGCTLYEMIAGRPPFVGEITEVLLQHITEKHRSLEELAQVPEPLSRLIDRMLVKDMETRVQTMENVIQTLEEVQA
jgi:serine/threonine-protein kinase